MNHTVQFLIYAGLWLSTLILVLVTLIDYPRLLETRSKIWNAGANGAVDGGNSDINQYCTLM